MSKLQFEKIDDNYIHDNLDEIVNLMIEILPEKSSNSRNWRRNMKKEDASDNLSYIGFAILNKFKHIYNNYDKRVDALYDKEELIERELKNQEIRVPKLESQLRKQRDINYFLQEELISRMDETDYHIMMSAEFGHNKY